MYMTPRAAKEKAKWEKTRKTGLRYTDDRLDIGEGAPECQDVTTGYFMFLYITLICCYKVATKKQALCTPGE
jgi:hypothetical protein